MCYSFFIKIRKIDLDIRSEFKQNLKIEIYQNTSREYKSDRINHRKLILNLEINISFYEDLF